MLVGASDLSTARGMDVMLRGTFEGGGSVAVAALELPRAHAFAHLDTILTMIDASLFARYSYLDLKSLRLWVITPMDPERIVGQDAHGPYVEHRDDLFAILEDTLGRDMLTVLHHPRLELHTAPWRPD